MKEQPTKRQINAAKQFRDNGQFAFQNDWGRMCVCGHELGAHAAGGVGCLNEDRRGALGNPKPEWADPTIEPSQCDCQKFRPSRRKQT